MDHNTEHYLTLCHQIISRSGNEQPLSEFLGYYEQRPDDVSVETDENGNVYCDFAVFVNPVEDIHLFVFEQDQIIADYNAVHVKVDDIFHNEEAMKRLIEVSDWMMLEGLLLGKIVDPGAELPDPDGPFREGEALLVNSSYVAKRCRRRGIYRTMMDAARDFASRHVYTDMPFYTVTSLDPDIASVGEDAVSEPYYYSREKDDPKRELNKTIAMHCGMNPVHLNIDNLYDPETQDGTKEWYGVKADQIVISKPVLS